MSDKIHYRRLEQMYYSAPFNQYFQPKLTITKGKAKLVIPIGPTLHHAAHAAHGSVYFKAMDDAAFFACSSLVDDVFILTTNFTVYFLKPIIAGEMIAHGEVTDVTKKMFLAQSVVTNAAGEIVGRGSGSFVRSKTPLSEKLGYRDKD